MTVHWLSDLLIGVFAFRLWKRKNEKMAVDLVIVGLLCVVIALGR